MSRGLMSLVANDWLQDRMLRMFLNNWSQDRWLMGDDELKYIKYSELKSKWKPKSKLKHEECLVCYNEYKPNTEVYQFEKCQHYVCKECKTKINKCPLRC